MLDSFLEQLLKDKTQTNLVALFFASPERSIFMGELEKRLRAKDLGDGLNKLIKNGIILSFMKKNLRYYRINTKHPLYYQLKEIIGKHARGYQDELVREIRKLPGVKRVLLTGLFTGSPHFECDIVIIGEPGEKPLNAFILGTQNLMGQELNYAVFTETEFEYRRNIFDRFTKDIMEHEHLIFPGKGNK